MKPFFNFGFRISVLHFLFTLLSHGGEAEMNDQDRLIMVKEQIEARGVKDSGVLAAMRMIPRHKFVPKSLRDEAYEDYPLDIGYKQTISQPYIVAYMTELLGLKGKEKVLEIGTGSGYQAAVLSKLTDTVFSIEIICELERAAKKILKEGGYNNVVTRCADGHKGWKEHAPYDVVILTAAPPRIPQPLIDQLKIGGHLVAPVGGSYQRILRLTKTKTKVKVEKLIGVRFVPMTGESALGEE